MPKISQLPAASVLNSNDAFAIVQGGITKQIPASLVIADSSAWLTYTPVISFTGGSGNVIPTFTGTSGRYTQVGNVVFVSIILTNSSGGTAGAGSGQLNVSLPIISGTNSSSYITAGVILNGSTAYSIILSISGLSGIASVAYLSGTTLTAANGSSLNDANTRIIECSFFYEV